MGHLHGCFRRSALRHERLRRESSIFGSFFLEPSQRAVLPPLGVPLLGSLPAARRDRIEAKPCMRVSVDGPWWEPSLSWLCLLCSTDENSSCMLPYLKLWLSSWLALPASGAAQARPAQPSLAEPWPGRVRPGSCIELDVRHEKTRERNRLRSVHEFLENN